MRDCLSDILITLSRENERVQHLEIESTKICTKSRLNTFCWCLFCTSWQLDLSPSSTKPSSKMCGKRLTSAGSVCVANIHRMTFFPLFCRYAYPSVSAEKRLCRELMANYSSLGINGRPVINMSTAIVVSFSLGLINMDLDEKHKILISSMWSRYVRTFSF